MDAVTTPRFVPPMPARPDKPLSLTGFLRAVRTNAITMWPDAAYEQDPWSAVSLAAAAS